VTDQPDDAAPETQEESVPAPPLPPRKVGLLAAIAATVVILDLISKIVIVATVQPGEPIRILGGLVYLSLIRNPGAAFSMATGMTWVLALIAIGVVIFIIRMAPRLRSTPWAVSLGLVLGGATGNLIDRIFRAPGFLQGHVVDFVSVFGPNAQYFPVFNVADSAITIGGISLVITALLGIDFDGSRTTSGKPKSA
jgi:signal peptidase II